MKQLLFLAALGLATTVQAQSFSLASQHHFGTAGADFAPIVLKTPDGGYLIAATSRGSDVDHASAAFGGGDYWLVKLDAAYAIEWEQGYGGSADEQLMDIELTPEGNYLLAGLSYSGADGNKTSASFGDKDFWVVKVDPLGAIVWQKAYGSAGPDELRGAIVLSETEYLFAGLSSGGISGTKTTASYGSADTWIVKTDEEGAVLGDHVYGGSDNDELIGLYKTSGSRIFLNNFSYSPVSGNKTSALYGAGDVWIVEIGADLGLLNQQTFGGSSDEMMLDMIEANGNLVLAGSSSSDISGNKTSALLGPTDAWMLKLTPDLAIVSDDAFGGSYCVFEHIIPISDQRYILTGVATAQTNPWKTRAGQGSADVWITGFDPDFTYEWNYSFGGSGYDGESTVFELSNNHFTVFAESQSVGFSGDLTVANYGNADIWQTELSTTVGLSENAAAYGVYPNPFTNSIHIMSEGGYDTYTLYSMQGTLIQQGPIGGQIDVEEHIAPGAYWLSLSGGTTSEPILLVKGQNQ